MKLAALSVVLLSGLLLAQAPQSYRTLHSTSIYGYTLQTKFFDAVEGNQLLASISCNFVDYACLAATPVYWDGVHSGIYYHFRELVSLHQVNISNGTQQQFFVLNIKPLTTKQIQVIAMGEKLSANYTLLVQENTGVDTK